MLLEGLDIGGLDLGGAAPAGAEAAPKKPAGRPRRARGGGNPAAPSSEPREPGPDTTAAASSPALDDPDQPQFGRRRKQKLLGAAIKAPPTPPADDPMKLSRAEREHRQWLEKEGHWLFTAAPEFKKPAKPAK